MYYKQYDLQNSYVNVVKCLKFYLQVFSSFLIFSEWHPWYIHIYMLLWKTEIGECWLTGECQHIPDTLVKNRIFDYILVHSDCPAFSAEKASSKKTQIALPH